MTKIAAIRRGKWWLALSVLAAAAAGGGAAYAAFPQSDVATYTGCIGVGGNAGGQLSGLTQGNEPAKPCSPNQQVVHLSGGDITEVAVGSGLTGGGSNGAVSIGLDAGHSLPQSCAQGQVPKADDKSAWVCGDDNDTQYSADANGGLYQSGTRFGIQSNSRLPQGCNFGQVPVQRNGFWGCMDEPKAEPPAFHRSVGFVNVAQSGWTEVARLPLASGTYFVSVTGFAEDDGGSSADNEVSVECQLFRNGTRWADSKVDIGDEAADSGPAGSLAMTAVVGNSGGFTMYLYCTTHTGSDHVSNVAVTAIPLGTVTS